ncbi:hypothetical protein GYMLUDRAFT_47165 [Collybiopsis luxurians FD-317 M1]|uniref:RING-type domain-containing protein n=1 Tax=Collybiopsis luxurians FD-317 M1 TaxID=944289 RepID=A0A0D0C265_9AGAR|nr:hypothetical protein GYMLUDRAFT_47165 [Collybiopsis luxurians FD-317 M1]
MASQIAPSQHHAKLLNSGLGSSYNISFNLSSILAYPSRFLARIIHKGQIPSGSELEATLMDATTTSLWVDADSTISSVPAATSAATAKVVTGATPAFPGPWGFFSSGYMCGLLIMGVLMHRIDNIFVPTTTNTLHHHPAHNAQNRSGSRFGRSFINHFLPIDINRTATRLAIHLPTIYLMCRVLLLWGIMLLQTADLFPWALAPAGELSDSGNFSLHSIMYRLGTWSASQETEDVCWHTFCAICAAFCVEGFVKALDGNGHGFGFGFAEHMQANTSPFNLVGYAFLLHIYSSPLTHAYKPYKPDFNSNLTDFKLLPSRPDTHVLITLVIPLLQLTLFHILSVRKRWSRHRLLPTALTSLLSLSHFYITLIRYLMNVSSSSLQSPSASAFRPDATSAPSLAAPAYTYTPHHTTHGYPILNYIPNIFETMLLSTIVLTIFLNSITQLLLTGRVDKPLLGLGIGNGAAGEGWRERIPWDEDFGVVLLRIGTASLEATGLRGWGNEVGGVVASSLPDSGSANSPRRYGSIRLTRSGVAGVSPGSVTRADGQRRDAKARIKLLKGWNNEVRDVDLGSDAQSMGRRRLWGVNGILTLNRQWFTELKRFAKMTWSVLFGAMRVGWEVLRGRRKLFPRRSYRNQTIQNSLQAMPNDSGRSTAEEESDDDYRVDEAEEEIYQRFLRNEQVSDDDNDDMEDRDFDSSEEDDDAEEEVEEDDSEYELETVRLYADLANRESTPEASTASTMLAHMSYAGSSPLTRQRFGVLQRQAGPRESGSDNLPDVFGDGSRVADVQSGSRNSGGGGGEFDEARRNCVICTTEPRVIICWPCRCLAMCDSCRESLAARSSASKHRCPCCRRGVEGYSRIYIP